MRNVNVLKKRKEFACCVNVKLNELPVSGFRLGLELRGRSRALSSDASSRMPGLPPKRTTHSSRNPLPVGPDALNTRQRVV